MLVLVRSVGRCWLPGVVGLGDGAGGDHGAAGCADGGGDGGDGGGG